VKRARLLLPVLAAMWLLVVPAAQAADRGALSPLHAEPDAVDGGRIVDARGRQVLLRGVNVNALAEYWAGTQYPTVFALEPRDPARMAAIGWNTVRLLLSWSRVEPRPGVYDEAYLAEVAATVRKLRRNGLYTIIDMHQDAWGPALAAREGEACTPPALPGLGWDGAPAWATLDGALARCYSGLREFNAATQRAWEAFFTDETGPGEVGIQTRYVAMWRRVARAFARESAVAGFDLMNEPAAFSASDQSRLSAMYARALAAIREGERAGRGRRHLVLFEPSVLFSAVGRGAPPDFARDRDVVYAPHLYTGGFDGRPITEAAFAVARDEARGFGGAPVLTGEWGADPDRAGPAGDGYFLEHQRLQDSFQFGATLWTWRESCGDPHKVADYRAGRVPEVWGEWDVDCTTNTIKGPRTALVATLTRAYVRAAPGRLTQSSYDEQAGRLEATGVAPGCRGRAARRRCAVAELVAFYPRAKHGGLRLRLHGLGRARVSATPGGGRLVSARPRGGPWSLRVTPR